MASDAFVRVGDGKFSIDGKPYIFIGTNLWYGAILGSEGQARDRYFSYVLSLVDSEAGLGCCNFWAWGGLVAPHTLLLAAVGPLHGRPRTRGARPLFRAYHRHVHPLRHTQSCTPRSAKNHPRKDKK